MPGPHQGDGLPAWAPPLLVALAMCQAAHACQRASAKPELAPVPEQTAAAPESEEPARTAELTQKPALSYVR